MSDLTVVGRSSSHFTPVARMFAIELEVPFTFRPLFDLTSVDTADYDENPALKVPVRSLENTLAWLDANVDAVVAALPEGRLISFFEVALFCLVRHLPFRSVLDVKPYTKLVAFAEAHGQRASARETEYRIDLQ